MSRIVLQQVSSPYARKNRGRTLDHPVALKFVQKHVGQKEFANLAEKCTQDRAYFWGAKFERSHQIKNMPGALVLFRQSEQVFKIGVISQILISEGLADFLWGRDNDGETWGIVFAMDRVKDVDISAKEVNGAIGRKFSDNWQGMNALDGCAAEYAISFIRKELGLSWNKLVSH